MSFRRGSDALRELESKLRSEGYKYIACVDEVGRGCLAGDVVAAAVIMPEDGFIEGVKDSKKLSPKKREQLYSEILKTAIGVGIGRVDADTIDEINIRQATLMAMKMAVENIVDREGSIISPEYILVDAETIDTDIPQQAIIKGDATVYGIAAASIVGKVYRDRLCEEWGKLYPEYRFEKHKAYGTKEHRELIQEHGASEIHRMSFLKKILGEE